MICLILLLQIEHCVTNSGVGDYTLATPRSVWRGSRLSKAADVFFWDEITWIGADLLHALAILGLSERATKRQIARQYRNVVKRSHPDRFASDPQGAAEATERLRRINRAYEG